MALIFESIQTGGIAQLSYLIGDGLLHSQIERCEHPLPG